MSKPASIRLTPDQEDEMKLMGFENASKYIRWKMGMMTDEEVEVREEQKKRLVEINSTMNGIDQQTQIPFNNLVPQVTRNVDDAIRLAKLEAELDRYKSEYNSIKSKETDSLGQVDLIVHDRVNQRMKEMEFQQLVLDKGKLELQLKEKDLEISTVKSKLDDASKSLKMLDIAERLLPHTNTVLAGLGKAINNASSGGGLGGFLAGFGEIMQPQNAKLSEEEESSLELGKNMQAMFTQDELQQVLFTVAVLGQNKELIGRMPLLLDKLTKSQPTPQPNNGNNNATSERSTKTITNEEVELEEEEEEESDDNELGEIEKSGYPNDDNDE